jgi:hypothetical protein
MESDNEEDDKGYETNTINTLNVKATKLRLVGFDTETENEDLRIL